MHVIEYLGLAQQNIQSLKGIYKKLSNDSDDAKIDFKTFVAVILQQYFCSIADVSIRSIFDCHCEGLMSLEQFLVSFEFIKGKLPKKRGNDNYKNVKYKQGVIGICQIYEKNDKHNAGLFEYHCYYLAVRECVNFCLEDNIKYDELFKNESFEIKEDEKHDINLNNICYDKLIDAVLKNEFDQRCNEQTMTISADQIIQMTQAWNWSIDGFGDNDSVKWWICTQCSSQSTQQQIDWMDFKKIVYNFWFFSYFEKSIESQFKECFPEYAHDQIDDDHDDDFCINLEQIKEFAASLNLKQSDKMFAFCWSKVVDEEQSDCVDFGDFMQILQHIHLYLMAEWTLKYQFDSQSKTKENLLKKEDFLSIILNQNGIDDDDANHFIKICNLPSFSLGLFYKFAIDDRMDFDAFERAFCYKLLMELCSFYVADVCNKQMANKESMEYSHYFSIFGAFGLSVSSQLLSQQTCDSLAKSLFGSTSLSLSQFFIILSNRIISHRFELQIYGKFRKMSGDDRNYIKLTECVDLFGQLKDARIIFSKLYAMKAYICNYLKFWRSHHLQSVDSEADKWHFEIFLHCLTFHEFQINHGRSYLLLKTMNLQKEKLKMLKMKQRHIESERLLHSYYLKMVNSMKQNERKLIACKEQIVCDTNEFKAHFNGAVNTDNDLLSVSAIAPHRSSAVQLAKEHIARKGKRRGSVVINNNLLRQASVELLVEDVPNDFNPFGGDDDDDTTEDDDIDNSENLQFNQDDIDIDDADNFAPF